jgi:hypothetical protein
VCPDSLCGTQRLSPNTVTHFRAERILRQEINRNGKPTLELCLESEESEEADAAIEFNEQVDIATVAGLITRD